MTLQELCSKYDLTENTVKANFSRTQKTLLNKYGVRIIKTGRGNNVDYIDEQVENISDKRAITMFKETHTDLVLNRESLTLMNADFLIFLGIVSTPMAMFRGTPQEFLKYIGIKVNQDNLDMLEDALLGLVDRELIFFDTDEDIIILYIRRKVEKEMRLGIEMIQNCRRIAEENHKHKDAWLQLMRVWVAIQICAEDQPFTMQDLSELTGLSIKQVSECKKLLERNNIFISSRAGSYLKCLGTNVELNGIYNK